MVVSMPAATRVVAHVFDLGGESGRSVAGDRLPHLGQAVARDALDVGHLLPARAGSRAISFCASSLLSTTTESVWPSRSCRSRAMRSRSASFASRSTSACARRSLASAASLAAAWMVTAPISVEITTDIM